MQLLIDAGFKQDDESGKWYDKRVFVYVDEMFAKIGVHNTFTPSAKVLLEEPEEILKAINQAYADTEEEQTRLMLYASDVAKHCHTKHFPVRHRQRDGLMEFFFDGRQSFIDEPIFLFSIDIDRNDEIAFTTPDCIIYAEDNPIETELQEVFDVMRTETNYDAHCKEGANKHNEVWLDGKTAVYANTTHALAKCLRHGVQAIAHQKAAIIVEASQQTLLCQNILRSVVFPEVHAYGITFLSDKCNENND